MIQSPPKPGLLLPEWATVGIVVCLILVCCCVSWIVRLRAKADITGWDRVSETPKMVEIDLQGAVSCPGKYQFHPGVTLKEALQTAGIGKQADRKKINFKKVIYVSGTIEIPAKSPKPKKTKRKSPS
ncbi:MAG TPA: hypothetical protein VLF61_02105 [Rhabdochlamydiaceae bacterium]|nr:hypothetical protein [Rhabdochlamydiaceae bacterium]